METLEKFITTVDLTIPHNDNVYQFLYASQLYGTLFGVYGKFECVREENNNCTVKNINFKLINYKGCVNIGFEEVKLNKEEKNNKNKLTINLYVKPLIPLDQINLNKSFTIPNNTEIIFQRLVRPYKERLNNENTDGQTSKNDIFFDTEFNFRDGYYEAGNPERAGQDGAPNPLASPRCHQSNVRMKF